MKKDTMVKNAKKKICLEVVRRTGQNVATIYGLSDREEEVSQCASDMNCRD